MATDTQRAREEILNSKVVAPFGQTRLIARKHSHYYGPVYRPQYGTWILYNDEPLEVVHMQGNQYEERH